MLTSHSFTAYPIKRVPWKGFSEAVKKVKVTVGNKTRDVAVQRDILGLLLTTSFKEGGSIEIDKALTYSLAPLPLALATSDEYRRKTAKSNLQHALQTNHEEADTKICYLLHHALRLNNGEETVCVVRSSSGDVDIPIIL